MDDPVLATPSPEAPTGDLVRDLQELTARALPAAEVERVDGWWLRHDPGPAWWAATVLPHRDGDDLRDLLRRVVAAERFYAARRAVARFQISPTACPVGLDALLAQRGYRCESPMSLQVAPVAVVVERTAAAAAPARVEADPSPAWLATWLRVHGHTDREAELAMLRRVEPPSGYARVEQAGEVVAVGRAVADGAWAGVFGMATAFEARGRGAARTVLAALALWAADHGARQLFLQVEPDNAPAVRLYERAGFTEVSRYHYRVAP